MLAESSLSDVSRVLQLVRESLWAQMCFKGVSVLEGGRETHIQSTFVEEMGGTGGLNYGFFPALVDPPGLARRSVPGSTSGASWRPAIFGWQSCGHWIDILASWPANDA